MTNKLEIQWIPWWERESFKDGISKVRLHDMVVLMLLPTLHNGSKSLALSGAFVIEGDTEEHRDYLLKKKIEFENKLTFISSPPSSTPTNTYVMDGCGKKTYLNIKI